MPFTLAQKQALQAAILADPVMSAIPMHSDGDFAIAELLNALSDPAVLFWDTKAPTSALLDAIDFAKFTQVDPVDGTALQSNRLLAVQTKQMNLQTLVFGREFLDMSKAEIRGSLRDAVIQIPAGASGAVVTAAGASGVDLLNAGRRVGTRLEAILTSGTAQTGTVTANLFGYEGTITYQEVGEVRRL